MNLPSPLPGGESDLPKGQPHIVGRDIPETVPFAPKAIGAIVIRQPEFNQTIRTLTWRKGDAQRCSLCPAGMCGVNPCDTCTVVIPEVLDVKSALSYRVSRET